MRLEHVKTNTGIQNSKVNYRTAIVTEQIPVGTKYDVMTIKLIFLEPFNTVRDKFGNCLP